MSSKRALVVDDSKSARAFLSRILERHEITVDAAESAEAAIDYLTRNRPDVIFMDHMMPGMDGFQAVQSIKNNPRTSAIPILMYTSQEGDLYLGQARALGRRRRAAQADQAGRRHQDALPAAPGIGSPNARANYFHGSRTSAPDLVPANESAIIVEQPQVSGDAERPCRRFRRGRSAIRAAAAKNVARDSCRARHFPAEGDRRAAQLHRQHARLPFRAPAG